MPVHSAPLMAFPNDCTVDFLGMLVVRYGVEVEPGKWELDLTKELYDKLPNQYSFVASGDGDLQEGCPIHLTLVSKELP